MFKWFKAHDGELFTKLLISVFFLLGSSLAYLNTQSEPSEAIIALSTKWFLVPSGQYYKAGLYSVAKNNSKRGCLSIIGSTEVINIYNISFLGFNPDKENSPHIVLAIQKGKVKLINDKSKYNICRKAPDVVYGG